MGEAGSEHTVYAGAGIGPDAGEGDPVFQQHFILLSGNMDSAAAVPGDPLRAKFIAENFLENWECVNTVRNMLAFTGEYQGKRVTVSGGGMGMPSVGIYTYELFHFYSAWSLSL